MYTLAYLATKPAGADLVCLLVALILFVLATLAAVFTQAGPLRYSALVPAGLAAVVLAYLLS